MTVGILGKKIGMTQLFQEDGKWIPVTVVQAGPCRVLQVKSKEVAELPEEEFSPYLRRHFSPGGYAHPPGCSCGLCTRA